MAFQMKPALGAPTIPAVGYVRLPAVLAVFPVGRSTWWDGVQTGKYPPSVKLSEGVTAWQAEHIHALIRAAASGDASKWSDFVAGDHVVPSALPAIQA